MPELLTCPQPEAALPSLEPHEIEALIASPSELALARIEELKPFTRPYSDEKKFMKEAPVRGFLASQYFGYYDELIIALHAPEDAYRQYMATVVEQKPTIPISQPRFFEKFADPDDKDYLRLRALKSEWNVRTELYRCIDLLDSPEERTDYANTAFLQHGYHLAPSSMFCAITESSILTKNMKREVIHNYFRRGDVLHELDLYRCLIVEEKYEQSPIEGLALLDSIHDFIDEGLITIAQIQGYIDQRKSADTTRHNEPTYETRLAKQAELVLRLDGILPIPEGETPATLAASYLFDQPDDHTPRTFEAAILVHTGIVAKSRVVNWLAAYDTEHGSSYAKEFEGQCQRFAGEKEAGDNERVLHTDESKLDKIYNAYIAGNKPMEDAQIFEIYQNVLGYDGPNKAKVREIFEAYFDVRGLNINEYNMRDLQRLYSDVPGALEALIRHHIAEKKNVKLPDQDLELFEEISGLSRQELHDFKLEQLTSETSIYNLCLYLGHLRTSLNPLLSVDECVDLLTARLTDADLDTHDPQALARFCRVHLGRTLTEAHILPLLEESHRDKFPHGRAAMTIEDVERLDYYDLYLQAYEINDLLPTLGKQALERLITRSFELSNDQFVDCLPSIWQYASPEQRLAALDRIYGNPALTALTARSHFIHLYGDLAGYSRHIGNKPLQDALLTFAPKSAATFARRLSTKDLPFDVQVERSGANNLMPEFLEAGRRHLLNTYSYYYELSDRVKDVHGVETLLSRVRGKNTEKNELRALELVSLLTEVGGLRDAAQVDNIDSSTLSRQVAVMTLEGYGIDVTRGNVLAERLTANGMDPVKFAMWLHTSSRSNKLKDYLAEFVDYLADGHTIADWKLEHPLGNNLAGTVDTALLKSWHTEHVTNVNLPGIGVSSFQFTNDLKALIMCGSQPINNCLHYGYGMNQHAIGGLFNADTKILNIANKNGSPIANAIIRLTTTVDNKPTLLLEPLYTSVHDKYQSDELHRTTILVAEEYARKIGVELRIARFNYRNNELQSTAKMLWSDTETTSSHDTLLQVSNAPFTYTDTDGIKNRKTFLPTLQRKKVSSNLGAISLNAG